MRKILEDFCNDEKRSNGLLLIDMPTGTGKTYKVAEYIANNYEKIKGKIFFVTQLKKNLPEHDIRECFKNIGKEQEVDEVLLRVENNVDNLCNNFHSVSQELRKYIGDSLLLNKIEREINLINGGRSVNEENMFLVQQARDDLQNELERELRNKVTAYLMYDENGKERTVSQKKYLLEDDEEYKWITKLYPTTQTYKKKIFIMSLDKFLYRYSTIIEPPFNLFESDLLKNGIVFMDEFDGTKDVILNKIIKDGLDNQFGIIELFREIYVGLFNPQFTKLLTEESKYNKEINDKRQEGKKLKSPEEILEGLKKSATKLYGEYKFVFQFKIHEDFKEGIKFLFQDYKTHTIVDDKKKHLELEEDETNSVNWIKVETSESKSLDSNTGKNSDKEEKTKRSIYNLINELQSFLREFQTGIGFIADNYYHLKKEHGKEVYNISRESAIRTVLAEFGIEGRYQNYITINILSSAKRNKFDWRQLSDIVDASVYENGFRYYHIVDNDNHDTLSKMDYVAFNDSPEKFLCRLINRTKVVGISATATLPTPLANYDLKYLKSKCKGLIFELNDIERERLKKYFESYVENYDLVKIESKPLGYIKNLSPEAKADYEYYANQLIYNLDNDNGEKDYLKQRLLCFAEAVEFFFEQKNENVKSFLYFANSKGREYYTPEGNILISLFKKSQERHKKRGILKFLYGNIDEFEKRKEEIQDLLKAGNNVFVITTYATMGAGQNIHYEYDFDFGETAKINKLDYNLNKKDFDAIYLETPSHILVNNYGKISTDEDFVKYIYQIKFLQEAGDYRPYEILSKIRVAFINRDSGNGFDYIPNRRTKNLLFAYAKVVQQAVGRICRTPNKNKNIYVFYQSGLEKFIAPIADDYSEKMINPEFQALLNSCKAMSFGNEVGEIDANLQRLAETKDERAFQYKESIRSSWNKDTISRWEKIRDEVLIKPTLCDLVDTEYSDLYIEMPTPGNKYYVINKYDPNNEKDSAKYSFEKKQGYNCISAYSVMLPQMLKIPGVYDYLKSKGYAVYFEPNKYMLSENILKSIYQGALGEVVGRYIIETKMLNMLKLRFAKLPIEVYEKFDNRIKNVYFDFKNWDGSYDPNLSSKISYIRHKMKLTQADKLVVVNILKPKYDVKPYNDTIDGAILVLPYLYDLERKEWNYEGLKKLYDILIAI